MATVPSSVKATVADRSCVTDGDVYIVVMVVAIVVPVAGMATTQGIEQPAILVTPSATKDNVAFGNVVDVFVQPMDAVSTTYVETPDKAVDGSLVVLAMVIVREAVV